MTQLAPRVSISDSAISERRLLSRASEMAVGFDKGSKLQGTVLQRIANGDSTAVEECLDLYGGLVWTLCRRSFPNAADAEDAVQEIFTEIWQRAADFDATKGREVTFVAVLTRRRIVDRIRKQKSSPSYAIADIHEFDVPSDVVVDHAEVQDEARKAGKCMDKLSLEQQRILSLSIHHGVAHSQISEMLSMPLGTVKSFARRALIQLRDCMSRSMLLGSTAALHSGVADE